MLKNGLSRPLVCATSTTYQLTMTREQSVRERWVVCFLATYIHPSSLLHYREIKQAHMTSSPIWLLTHRSLSLSLSLCLSTIQVITSSLLSIIPRSHLPQMAFSKRLGGACHFVLGIRILCHLGASAIIRINLLICGCSSAISVGGYEVGPMGPLADLASKIHYGCCLEKWVVNSSRVGYG